MTLNTVLTNKEGTPLAPATTAEQVAYDKSMNVKQAIDSRISDEEYEVLNQRMNTFASLPDGSTTGDAELTDIRIGHDGTPYETAGEAVREQVSSLSSEINNKCTVVMEDMEEYNHYVWGASLSDIGNVNLLDSIKKNRITYMNRFNVIPGNKITVIVKDGYRVRCLFFVNSGSINIGTGYRYVSNDETDLTTWHTDNRILTVPDGASGVSISISKVDDSVIDLSECDNVIVYYGEITEEEINMFLGNDGNNAGLSYSKKGIFLGDSISFGFYSYFDGEKRCNADDLYPNEIEKTRASMRISDWFSKFYNIQIDNIAERGTGYVSDTRGLGNALVKANSTDFSQYDFVALCFGVNDYIQGCTIGTIEDKIEGTIIGNMIKVLEKIYSDNPYCKVVVFTPYNTWGQVRDSKLSQTYYGNESTNYALGHKINGSSLKDIIDAINSVCNYYGIKSIDLSNGNFCNRINIKNILVDGLHPTVKAMKALASEMYANMTFR